MTRGGTSRRHVCALALTCHQGSFRAEKLPFSSELRSQRSDQMLATCTLTPLKCQLCGSALVRAAQPEIRDRLICPICWAAGDYEEVVQGIATLQRGVRIEKEIRRRVDK